MANTFRLILSLVVLFFLSSCSANNEGSHTTVTTRVSPPPHQAITVAPLSVQPSVQASEIDPTADPMKPLLIFDLPEGSKFRVGESVPINFAVKNATLRGNGGEFRIRYIVDDDEMQWVDKDEPFALQGWVPGEHTVRIELVGPDGWPFRNGNANIVTRKIFVVQ